MKYFCIGHNKCATSTLATIFKANKISSHHGPMNWNLQDYDSFSDTGGVPFISSDKKNKIIHHSTNLQEHHSHTCKDFDIGNLIWLDELFNGSIFIYNMRSLEGWMLSRILHGLRLGGEINQFFPTTDAMLLDWICMRDYYMKKVFEYFSTSSSSLVLVDIGHSSWVDFLIDFLSFKKEFSFPSRNTTKENKESSYANLISFYDKYEISKKKRDSVIPSDLVDISKNFPSNISYE